MDLDKRFALAQQQGSYDSPGTLRIAAHGVSRDMPNSRDRPKHVPKQRADGISQHNFVIFFHPVTMLGAAMACGGFCGSSKCAWILLTLMFNP